MIRPALPRIILILALAVSALISGCDRPASKPPQVVKSTPEQRFENILVSFRRKIEDQPVGFVVSDGSTRSTMLGSNKVTSTLIPPTSPGSGYKATITVTTESHYSLRRTKSSIEEAEREKASRGQGSSALDGKENQGIDILDPGLAGRQGGVSPPSASTTASEQDIVSRRPGNDVRKYELVDDGDRWQLVTKCDPKTEQSIQFAFEAAIALQ